MITQKGALQQEEQICHAALLHEHHEVLAVELILYHAPGEMLHKRILFVFGEVLLVHFQLVGDLLLRRKVKIVVIYAHLRAVLSSYWECILKEESLHFGEVHGIVSTLCLTQHSK